MSNENQGTFIGNCGKPPEIRFTNSGQAVATFSIAVSRRYKDQKDEWQEVTTWLDVTCWKELAENVGTSVTKGTRVIVVGRLDMDEWEDKDGEKRSKLKVTADSVGVDLRYATAEVARTERTGPTRDNAPVAEEPPGYGYGSEPF
jgi:single-strand DNA-binding protein